MIKKINDANNTIIRYIGKNYNECLYLYLDYLKYGLSNKNINIWEQIIDGKCVCIILKYFTGMHIFSKNKDLVYDEVIDLIKKEKPTIICSEEKIISSLQKKINNYVVEFGWIRKLSIIDKKYDNNEVITEIDKKDFKGITSLIMEDEMGNSYSFDGLLEQLVLRNEEKYSRNYIIKNEKEIISHAATGAEFNNLSVLSYVITNKKYRGKGYAVKVVGKLCYDLIKEGKEVYLVNYSDESTKLYDKLGFKISANIGKLVLKEK